MHRKLIKTKEKNYIIDVRTNLRHLREQLIGLKTLKRHLDIRQESFQRQPKYILI